MVRSIAQMQQAWLKATKEKPIQIKEGEYDNFIKALRLNEKINEGGVDAPYVSKPMSYISPMSGKEVTCPKQRKEEMKKYGVREVDPSEYREMLKDRGFDERRGQ